MNNKLTFLYCRLSREDGEDRESNSIGNQKRILTEYAEKNGFTPYAIAVDDGYTGTNYNRPGWQELMAKVEADEVSTIIVKNLDRMGRNYLQTGLYREMFQERGVRLIAVNDGIDTASGEGDDFLPFREIMAEWYARDCSRKVKAVFHSKGTSGKHIGSHPLYGYKKSEADKNLWVPDEPAASVVRRIFELTIEGFGPYTISEKLSAEKVECPSYYLGIRGCGNHQKELPDDPYRWWGGTVRDIIGRVEYLGHTVNFKTYRKSFKLKHIYFNEPEKWSVFENTHEPLVKKEVWELANKLRSNAKRHVDRLGVPYPLTGLLWCAQCGAKMYHDRSGPNAQKQKDHYTCSNYSTQHVTCTSHRVTTETIETLILETLRSVCNFADANEEDFRKMVTDMYSAKVDGDLKSRRKRLAVCEKRTAELDKLIRKLFEEHTLGSLAEKRFDVLSAGYEQEQAELELEISELRAEVGSLIDGTERADNFLMLRRRYRDFEELTPQMINEFVEKIIVHERADKGCRITEQKIEIMLNFIGDFTVPGIDETEDAARVARLAELSKRREYHREYLRRREANGGKPLLEKTPEERAAFEAEQKEKTKLYQREYQREWQRRKAREKREAKLAAEAAAQTSTSAA
jgi:DNA invertase Pin-like site-specific DNA recombinase